MTISLNIESKGAKDTLIRYQTGKINKFLQAAPSATTQPNSEANNMSSDLLQCIKSNASTAKKKSTNGGTLINPSWFKFKSSSKSSGNGGNHSNSSNGNTENSNTSTKMDLVQVLAINALELTAPAAFFLRPSITCSNIATTPPPKDSALRRAFIQVSGHPGSLAPAGPHTLWKKQTDSSTETEVYEYLSGSSDPMKSVIPQYHGKKLWNDEIFLELEDLLDGFGPSPAIMDIKMGSRTFLESEVTNVKARNDLYQKMVKVDPSGPTKEEHEMGAVTKLRYMKFREEQSSTSLLSFRIEAIQFAYSNSIIDVKTVQSKEQVGEILDKFLPTRDLKLLLLNRLNLIKKCLETSDFFMDHEVIGSSLLIVHDGSKVSAHLIDFAKTVKAPTRLSHRDIWEMGNHEDGYLDGLSNLIRILEKEL